MAREIQLTMIAGGKYKLKFRWKEVCDDHLSTCYSISPYWGSLYSGELTKVASQNLLGFRKDCKVQYLLNPQKNKTRPAFSCKSNIKLKIKIIKYITDCILVKLPLTLSIKIGSIFSSLFNENENTSEIQLALFEVLGENTHGTCLSDSLTRFFSLMKHGAVLSFGIFVPTNLMHAWVEIDNDSLDEDLNFLGHYQKSLEFYIVNNA